MTHAEMNREFQLERANLIAHISACRHMLATTQGILEANALMAAKGIGEFTEVEEKLLDRIRQYQRVGMFDQLPEGIER